MEARYIPNFLGGAIVCAISCVLLCSKCTLWQQVVVAGQMRALKCGGSDSGLINEDCFSTKIFVRRVRH